MDTPSGSNVEGSNGRAPQTWWSRQSDAVKTALIVGLTTLIGAIITGIFALAHAGGGSQTEPPVAESTTHSSGSAATTPQATTSSASGGTVGSTPRSQAASSYSSSSIYWSGPVGIVGEGLDFDIRPPATATSSLSNIYTDNGSNLRSADPKILLSVWKESSVPTASDCNTWATTHPSAYVSPVSTGMQICVRTTQGRFGLLHIDATAANDIEATATIWGQ